LVLKKVKGFTVDDIINVKDWEKRMSALNYSSEQRNLISTAQKKQAEWFKVRDTAKWTHQTSDKGVDIHYLTSARKLNCFKASGVVDFPPWVCH
jgi:hypothetical protein